MNCRVGFCFGVILMTPTDATWHYKPKILREGELKEVCEQAIAEVVG